MVEAVLGKKHGVWADDTTFDFWVYQGLGLSICFACTDRVWDAMYIMAPTIRYWNT